MSRYFPNYFSVILVTCQCGIVASPISRRKRLSKSTELNLSSIVFLTTACNMARSLMSVVVILWWALDVTKAVTALLIQPGIPVLTSFNTAWLTFSLVAACLGCSSSSGWYLEILCSHRMRRVASRMEGAQIAFVPAGSLALRPWARLLARNRRSESGAPSVITGWGDWYRRESYMLIMERDLLAPRKIAKKLISTLS